MRKLAGLSILCASAALGLQAPAPAHKGTHERAPGPPGRAASEIRGPGAGHSSVPTPAFDGQGRLWVVWVEGDRVWVSASADQGRTFRRATRVTSAPESIDSNGEGRPKIAIGPGGEIYVTWTHALSKPYTGDILFARSLDDGRTFSRPVRVNDDHSETGHRFDTLVVAPDGSVAVLWIDKRGRDGVPRGARKVPGGALYAAWSRDRGATFGPNLRIEETVCECCRIAAVPEPDGRIAVFYRDIFGDQIRDHAVVRLASGGGAVGRVERATFDDWKLDGCPHHGPALAVDASGTWHLAWWTGAGKSGRGVFYARDSSEAPPSAPRRIGSDRAAHPALAADGRRLALAWIDYPKGTGARVTASSSIDGGRNWSAPRPVLTTSGESDHPQLAAGRGGIYLTWYTEGEGFRILNVAPR